MNQDDVIDSLEKHLDLLSALIRWALLFAVVFWWAGVDRHDVVEAFGMKIQRQQALWVAVVTYIIVNLAVLDSLLRIGDLFQLVDSQNMPKAISRVALHPWTLNPFSYFGSGFVARFHSAKGFGALIVVWWVGNSSIYSFTDAPNSLLALLLQGAFLVVGLSSMAAINRVYAIVLSRTKRHHSKIHDQLKATRAERNLCAFAGIGIGAAFAYATQFSRFFS